MEQFAYLCNKMNRIEEANGKSLLDNIMFTYGSGLGDGSTHQYSALTRNCRWFRRREVHNW